MKSKFLRNLISYGIIFIGATVGIQCLVRRLYDSGQVDKWPDGKKVLGISMNSSQEDSEDNKAAFSTRYNRIVFYHGEEASRERKADLNATLDSRINTIIEEIPAVNDDFDGNHFVYFDKSSHTFKYDKTKTPQTRAGTNVMYKKSWLTLLIYDSDGIKSVDAYEIDPETKEKIRKIRLSTRFFETPEDIDGRKGFAMYFDKEGIGKASMIRIDVIDSNGNVYDSYIKLKRKEKPDDNIPDTPSDFKTAAQAIAPISVKTRGTFLRPPQFEVATCDLKSVYSAFVN